MQKYVQQIISNIKSVMTYLDDFEIFFFNDKKAFYFIYLLYKHLD